jgi:hypothetical protein
VLAGHFLSRPLFEMVAASGLWEAFTAVASTLVVGVAVLVMLVGLSPALGTFLAGVVLANGDFRHELETDIEPFEGLPLGPHPRRLRHPVRTAARRLPGGLRRFGRGNGVPASASKRHAGEDRRILHARPGADPWISFERPGHRWAEPSRASSTRSSWARSTATAIACTPSRSTPTISRSISRAGDAS